MRDPARIKPFLEEFEALWAKNPDIRFGQLVVILQGQLGGTLDPFYTEDDELLAVLRRLNGNTDNE
ncbi:MAG: hypothetical protein E7553_07230 [Ruminococcaceae bacterium]|nr:hypothetical protein [Oscillospiraceae bacterium]